MATKWRRGGELAACRPCVDNWRRGFFLGYAVVCVAPAAMLARLKPVMSHSSSTFEGDDLGKGPVIDGECGDQWRRFATA